MADIDVKLYVLARVSAGSADKTIPIEKDAAANPNTANHLFIPLFANKEYHPILHGRTLPNGVALKVPGPTPTESAYLKVADTFVRNQFVGYELVQTGIGTSYWNGSRWVPPQSGQQAFAYQMKKTGGASKVEYGLEVKDSAGATDALNLQFIVVIQKG